MSFFDEIKKIILDLAGVQLLWRTAIILRQICDSAEITLMGPDCETPNQHGVDDRLT
jgi:hypothetical protein